MGTLSADCSICECENETISGTVRDNTSIPLIDVAVYLIGHEWESEAVTDISGHFTILDICLDGLQMEFELSGYLPEEEMYDASSGFVNATLIQMSMCGVL